MTAIVEEAILQGKRDTSTEIHFIGNERWNDAIIMSLLLMDFMGIGNELVPSA